MYPQPISDKAVVLMGASRCRCNYFLQLLKMPVTVDCAPMEPQDIPLGGGDFEELWEKDYLESFRVGREVQLDPPFSCRPGDDCTRGRAPPFENHTNTYAVRPPGLLAYFMISQYMGRPQLSFWMMVDTNATGFNPVSQPSWELSLLANVEVSNETHILSTNWTSIGTVNESRWEQSDYCCYSWRQCERARAFANTWRRVVFDFSSLAKIVLLSVGQEEIVSLMGFELTLTTKDPNQQDHLFILLDNFAMTGPEIWPELEKANATSLFVATVGDTGFTTDIGELGFIPIPFWVPIALGGLAVLLAIFPWVVLYTLSSSVVRKRSATTKFKQEKRKDGDVVYFFLRASGKFDFILLIWLITGLVFAVIGLHSAVVLIEAEQEHTQNDAEAFANFAINPTLAETSPFVNLFLPPVYNSVEQVFAPTGSASGFFPKFCKALEREGAHVCSEHRPVFTGQFANFTEISALVLASTTQQTALWLAIASLSFDAFIAISFLLRTVACPGCLLHGSIPPLIDIAVCAVSAGLSMALLITVLDDPVEWSFVGAVLFSEPQNRSIIGINLQGTYVAMNPRSDLIHQLDDNNVELDISSFLNADEGWSVCYDSQSIIERYRDYGEYEEYEVLEDMRNSSQNLSSHTIHNNLEFTEEFDGLEYYLALLNENYLNTVHAKKPMQGCHPQQSILQENASQICFFMPCDSRVKIGDIALEEQRLQHVQSNFIESIVYVDLVVTAVDAILLTMFMLVRRGLRAAKQLKTTDFGYQD